MIPINNVPTACAKEDQVFTGNTMIKKDEAGVLYFSGNPRKHDTTKSPCLDGSANSKLTVSNTSAFQNNVQGFNQIAPKVAMVQQEQPVVVSQQQHMMMMQSPHGQVDYMWNPAQQQNNMSDMRMVPASAFAQMQTMNSHPLPQQVTKQQQPQQQPVLDPKKAKKFPMKLMLVLCNDEYNHILTWNEQGDRFTIHDPEKVCKEILPKYFKKGSKFPSFLRKLYRWGFVKRPQSKGGSKEVLTYFHPNFQRGEFKLCEDISCNNGGATAIETVKYFIENANNNGVSSNSMNTASMYPHLSFQNMGANYYMTGPNNFQGMNENSQFYNQAVMMNAHSVNPSLSSGTGIGSTFPDNSANSDDGNYYSVPDNGGGRWRPPRPYHGRSNQA